MNCHPNNTACHDYDVAEMRKDIVENFHGFSLSSQTDCPVFKDFSDSSPVKYPDLYGAYKLGNTAIQFSIEHRAHVEQWMWKNKTNGNPEIFNEKQYHSKFFIDIIDSQYRMAKIINLMSRGVILIETNRYHSASRNEHGQIKQGPHSFMSEPPALLNVLQGIYLTSPLDYFDLINFNVNKFDKDKQFTYPPLSAGVKFVSRELHNSIEVNINYMQAWNEENLRNYVRYLYKKYEALRQKDVKQRSMFEFK